MKDYWNEEVKPYLSKRDYWAEEVAPFLEEEKPKELGLLEKMRARLPFQKQVAGFLGGVEERGVAEGLEKWREFTEPTPIAGVKPYSAEEAKILASNIGKQALALPRFPIDIAQQAIKEPLETAKQLAQYPPHVFGDYMTYISPLSSSEQRREAIEGIAEDPLGLFFAVGITKGGLRGAQRFKMAVKRARQKKGLPIEEPPAEKVPTITDERIQELTTERKFAKEKGAPSVFEKKKPALGEAELRIIRESYKDYSIKELQGNKEYLEGGIRRAEEGTIKMEPKTLAYAKKRLRVVDELLKEPKKPSVPGEAELKMKRELEKPVTEKPAEIPLREQLAKKESALEILEKMAPEGKAKVQTRKRLKKEISQLEADLIRTEETELHAGIPIPDFLKKRIEAVKTKLFKKPQGEIEKATWDIKRDWYYQKEGLTWKYRQKWDKEVRQKLSKQEQEDMIFYRQRTGNVFKKGDTFEDVKARLSPEVRSFVDVEASEHMSNMKKTWNELPGTKDIVAREEVAKTYLTGFYAGNVDKAWNAVVRSKGRTFATANFMVNRKKYLNFMEAFREAGLVPRFRSFADQMNAQDAYMIKMIANNKLINDVYALEKSFNTKLIIRSDSKFYNEAKSAGYVPYDDYFLRVHVVEKKPDGSLAWGISKAPALLHPEVSSAFVDVFRKDAYQPSSKFWKGYDTATDAIRTIRVSFSGFHFIPLGESLFGGKGLGALNIPEWIKKGRKLLDDSEFMTEAVGSGLRLHAPREARSRSFYAQLEGMVNRLEIQGGLGRKVAAKGINLASFIPRHVTHFLFHKYMPLLKVNIFHDYKYQWIKAAEKQGIKMTEAMRKEGLTDIATLTNDQFGAQAWSLMRGLNDPKVMKWVHRFVGYPDWTISALRQARAGVEGGIRGKLGRKYWLRYGIGFVVAQNAVNYLTTGHSTFENPDPKHKLDFQLPDIEINIAGVKFNPGREAITDKETGEFLRWGRRRYSHFGKQALEIPRYATKTISQAFSKSNPLIQMFLTQIMGGKPYKGKIFPARGEFGYRGTFEPWGGTKPMTVGRQIERAKQLVSDVLPFSIQQVKQTGPGTAGLTPISKGLSLYEGKDYIEKAMKDGDRDRIIEIVAVLLDGGYLEQYIKRAITEVENKLLKERSEQ